MKKLITSALILYSSSVFALSLDQAYTFAAENSPDIRVQKLSINSQKWEKTKAMADFLPQLSAGFSHDFDYKYQQMEFGSFGEVPVILPISEFDLRASLNIFNGWQGVNSYQAASLGYESSEHEYKRAEFSLRRLVRTQYYEALGAQILADVAEQKIRSLETHLSNMQSNFRSGYSTKYDILKAETQLADARTEKLLADDKIQVEKDKLAHILGVPSIDDRLEGDLPNIESFRIPTKLEATDIIRDDITAQQLQEQKAHKIAAAAKSWWAPAVDLFAEKQFYNNINSDWDSTNDYKDAYFIGVNIRWKFFDGGSGLANQIIAANNAKVIQEKLRASTMDVPRDIGMWQRKYSYSLELYKSKKLSITKSEQTVQQARDGVRAGTRTNEDILNSQLELFQSKARMVQAKIDAIEALGQLELATGKELIN